MRLLEAVLRSFYELIDSSCKCCSDARESGQTSHVLFVKFLVRAALWHYLCGSAFDHRSTLVLSRIAQRDMAVCVTSIMRRGR